MMVHGTKKAVVKQPFGDAAHSRDTVGYGNNDRSSWLKIGKGNMTWAI
jgi:hypothetical protein